MQCKKRKVASGKGEGTKVRREEENSESYDFTRSVEDGSRRLSSWCEVRVEGGGRREEEVGRSVGR